VKDGSFSFGTSRSVMQKVHIDRIVIDADKGNLGPSPDLYQSFRSSFETVSPHTPSIGVRRHVLE